MSRRVEQSDASDPAAADPGFLPDQGAVRVRRGGRVVLGVLFGLLLVAGAAYLAAYEVAGDKIPHGTHISGVDVGGMTPSAAEAELREKLRARGTRPIQLTYQDAVRTTTATQAGLSVDYHGSVQAARGGSRTSLGHLWNYFFGGDDVAARVLVDEPRLQATIAKFSTGVGLPVHEGTIRFEAGKAVPVYSKAGIGVDRTALVARLKKAYLMPTTPAALPVPTATEQPTITDAAVKQAMRDFARPAMSAPVVLIFGGHKISAPPRLFSAALTMVPSGRALVPVVDGEALMKSLAPVLKQFAADPVNARLVGVDGKPKVVPAKIGLSVNTGYLEDHFAEYAARPDQGRVMTVPSVLRQPTVTTAKIRGLHVDRKLAETSFRLRPAQRAAARRAAAKVNGALLRPGQTLDVRARLGALAAADDDRGGVDAVATGVYAASFAAGYADGGHTLAGVHRDGQPSGMEVTLGNDAPLAVTDDAPTAAMLTATVRGGTLTVRVWGTPDGTVSTSVSAPEGVTPPPTTVGHGRHCHPRAGRPGYTVTVSRTVTRGDTATPTSYQQSYRPVPGVRCQ